VYAQSRGRATQSKGTCCTDQGDVLHKARGRVTKIKGHAAQRQGKYCTEPGDVLHRAGDVSNRDSGEKTCCSEAGDVMDRDENVLHHGGVDLQRIDSGIPAQ
jgi:hypothetical protein